jgi:hypothetical protein
LPKPRKKTERPRWKLKAAVEFIDAILRADRKAPRKQRHTAQRVWERIQIELPHGQIGERTVRQYVHDRKIALGFVERDAEDIRLRIQQSPKLDSTCPRTFATLDDQWGIRGSGEAIRLQSAATSC